MTVLTLTKTHVKQGIWEGVVTAPEGTSRPDIRVTHLDQSVDGVELLDAPDGEEGWRLRIPIPPHAIADGVQTFLIIDAASDDILGHFTLLAGEAVPDDLLSEVELLRAELDMLKRAFRRHCLETA